MKNKLVLRILVILGVVVFTGRLMSHLFLFLGENQDRVVKTKYLKASHMFFPLDYFSAYKNGFGWLQRGFKEKDNQMLNKSIVWFKKSLSLNPFFHYSHYHLGKAYLFFNYPKSEFFNEGVAELKQAVKIYHYNKYMIRDISEVFMSMWPLLNEEDQQLSRDLLLKHINRFSWEEFKPIAQLWWHYSKEIPTMNSLMEKNPSFLAPMAQMLISVDGPLNLRWAYLADHETHVLNTVIRRYRHGPQTIDSNSEFEHRLLNQLKEIRRYETLVFGKTFNEDRYRKHMVLLIGQRIRMLINQHSDDMLPSVKEEISRLVLDCIEAGPELKAQLEMQNFLERKGFFKANDFEAMYLKYRIQFSQAGFRDMIDEIETLRQSISFVKEQHMNKYIQILLLLSDAYESSKLLTIADSVLRNILEMDADNLDVWWRFYRIQLVLGDDELTEQDKFNEKVNQLKQSRFLTINEPQKSIAVFLINVKEIQVTVNPDLINKLRDKKIIQIFIDGLIRYEEYLDRLPVPIKLNVKEAIEMEKVEVEVRFI